VSGFFGTEMRHL